MEEDTRQGLRGHMEQSPCIGGQDGFQGIRGGFNIHIEVYI